MKKRTLSKISALLMSVVVFSPNVWATEISMVGTMLRNAPAYETTIDFKPACYVFTGESFTIVDVTETHYGILLQNNEMVYVTKENICAEEVKPVKEPLVEATPSLDLNDSWVPILGMQTAQGEEIVEFAKQFIGVPYVYGGNDLRTGVDCSGFTQQVYSEFGIKLARNSNDQYLLNGYNIEREVLRPGDLVFYGYGDKVTHISMYIGEDQVIHSPAPGQSISIAPVWQNGDAPLMGFKRIL